MNGSARGIAAAAPARLSRRKRIVFAVVVLVLFVLLLEPAFRLAYSVAGGRPQRLRNAANFYSGDSHPYVEPWPYVGFRFRVGIDPFIRDDGFMSTHEIPKARSEPTIRIAFVGASTTQGSADQGYLGSFPFLIEGLLKRAHLPVETLNCGVYTWTSVENLIHYELSIQDYKPDWVVIHQGANDVQARLYKTFRSDYGHARRALVLPDPGLVRRFLVRNSWFYAWLMIRAHGIPSDVGELVWKPLPPPDQQKLAPEGVEVFRRNTETLVDVALGGGARVLLTTESHNRRPRPGEEIRHGLRTSMDEFNEVIRDMARRRGLPLADTEKALDFHGDLFTDYVHVVTKGNRIKARVMARALLQAGLRDDPRFHVERSR